MVLHGGGNTSVKITDRDYYGNKTEVLYIKASGWDLATIKKEGFAPVEMAALLKMAEFDKLTDTQMVKLQRQALLDPYAPNPSVEAILHAVIPFKFVDHTHADSIVTISNSKNGFTRLKKMYGDNMLYVPYVMPGFILAKKVFEMTKNINWHKIDGIVLLHHGVFTFSDDPKESYERMIGLVTKAEKYLAKHKTKPRLAKSKMDCDLVTLARLRKEVSRARGGAVLAKVNSSELQAGFSMAANLKHIATQGPLTPDHVIRTKRIPMLFQGNPETAVDQYRAEYKKYFKLFKFDGLKILDTAPRWAVWPGVGSVVFGQTLGEANIIRDIVDHTVEAIQRAEKLGGWQALPAKDIFEVEYWELEQAKLKKAKSQKQLLGKIALVSGAASGIGKACVDALVHEGACVAALDINPAVEDVFNTGQVLGIVCDMAKEKEIEKAVHKTVKTFGGLDILISNAGIFPPSARIGNIDNKIWQKSMDINLSSHQMLMQKSLPYLKAGIDSSVIIIASKNVPAPGPGAGTYSVAKAGLTQLARVAALELAEFGIRVNVLHPNAVFDTAIWTEKVIKERARQYKLSVEEYKKNNLLKVEINSADVANLAVMMATSIFAKTTGAQIPIDGGNERVI